MKELLLQLRSDDRVVMFSDESTEKTTLRYEKFVDYIKQFVIKDSDEFFKNVNKFNIILLHLKSGDWEVKKKLNECSISTFNEMCQTEEVTIHSSNEEYMENKNIGEDSKNNSPLNNVVDQAKQFIFNMYEGKKENATDIYRRKR